MCDNAATQEGCETTGLANIGSACSTDGKAGSINEDRGLGHLTVIIAHEIGHLLGLDHDELVKPCNVTDTDGAHYVMSPYIHTFTTKWSPCSRNDLKLFFDANLGECLNDEPSISLYPYVDHMPGVVFDADEQCRIVYPESRGACRTPGLDFCSYFTCMVRNNTSCTGVKGEGPVDGTKCGENKWCYKQKCVPMGSRPEAINGGWSDWNEWSACSRTCGGGIAFQERTCDNPSPANRGKYCTGDRKRMKLCNVQLCPENSTPYREFQCEQQNLKPSPLDQQHHKWSATYNFDVPCSLICFTKDLGLYDFESVKDGTLCKPGTRDVCISGVCRPVGCDLKLDSDAVEDRCGICNGDGTTCKIVDGTYDDKIKDPSKMPNDYVFAKIPMGSRKIFIKEVEESPNIIAISNGNKKAPTFYLNKDGKSSFRGFFKIPGTRGLYFMRGKSEKQDHVFINGPISVDLAIWVMYYKSSDGTFGNPGYYYSWAEEDEQNKYEPVYSWEIGEYGDCSARCGGGIQEAIWSCMEEKGGRVSPTFCIGINKPVQPPKKCNEQPCKARWNVGSWGRCHACKKKGGVRTRPVECLKQNPKLNGDAVLVDDSECSGVKPGAIQLCQTDKKCTARKKRNVHIPGKHQELVWQQMSGVRIEKRLVENSTPIQNVTQCDVIINGTVNLHQNSTVPPSSISVGKFVRDGEPLEGQKLVEFELIRQNVNISDNQMRPEETGNPLGTTKIYSGRALATFIHNFEFTQKTTGITKSKQKRKIFLEAFDGN
ncbi:A disintegrin and metalloproteinase with thrombospondin motifs 7-like [Rhynchophorus ferrugineus]|uniref:A disintegrin and metalloproteinase with thrombospondin motifs 7-like n=1 Tax=Rhynchophorus ferrugineus TaxID=354439 RepID=UPI003FCDDDC0